MEHDDHVQVPATRQAPPASAGAAGAAGAEPGPPGVAPAEAGGKIPPVSLADIQAFNSSRSRAFRYSARTVRRMPTPMPNASSYRSRRSASAR